MLVSRMAGHEELEFRNSSSSRDEEERAVMWLGRRVGWWRVQERQRVARRGHQLAEQSGAGSFHEGEGERGTEQRRDEWE